MALLALALIASLVSLDLTSAQTCKGAPTVSWGGHNYFFSWEYGPTRNQELDWVGAQNVCRQHCMNLVSIEHPNENSFIKQRIASGSVKYIWTSGRRCPGCSIVTGWRWSGSGVGIGSSNNRANGDWSHTGGGKKFQPDNRENTKGDFGYRGNEEECLSILNNFYNDGIKWHDVACYHTKPFVCES